MKKIIKFIVVFILFIFFLILDIYLIKNTFYDKYKIPEEVVFNYENEVVLSSNENYFNLIKDKNVDILSEDEKINTESTGTKTKTITIKYNKKKYYYKMNVNVIDVTKPLILNYQSNITTTLMNVAYPCDRALYIDDYDTKPSCVIDGNVSYDEEGSYPVKMTISDKSGNKVEKDVTIKVVEKISSSSKGTSSSSKPTYINFEDIVKEHKNNNTMIGIDISKWQGNIDFDKVKEAGCEFVIIRIGVQAGRNYEHSVDSNYSTYIKDAKRAGLKVGVYVYTTALNYDDGVKTAEFVINTLGDEKLDLGVSYDWENYQYIMEYETSLRNLSDGYKGFRDKLKSKGLESHFYASKYYLENFWIDIDEPVWLAHYNSETTYQGKYFMWQRTSNGKIDGIPDNTVDIDILYK